MKRNTFEDILADAGVPVSLQRQVQFADIATSTPIQRPVKHLEDRIPHVGASQVASHTPGLFSHQVPQKDLYEEGFAHSLQVAATEFKKGVRAQGDHT